MPLYALRPDQRFPAAFARLARRVTRLEARTAGIDSGMPLAILPAVIDSGYTAPGDPMAYINGSASLTGPYRVVGNYVPSAGDAVLVMPVPLTAVTAQAGSYVILPPLDATVLAVQSALLVGATAASTGFALEVHSRIALAASAAPSSPPSGFGVLYVSNSDGSLHYKDSAGTDTKIAS